MLCSVLKRGVVLPGIQQADLRREVAGVREAATHSKQRVEGFVAETREWKLRVERLQRASQVSQRQRLPPASAAQVARGCRAVASRCGSDGEGAWGVQEEFLHAQELVGEELKRLFEAASDIRRATGQTSPSLFFLACLQCFLPPQTSLWFERASSGPTTCRPLRLCFRGLNKAIR